jgi:hypothetical protein
VALLLVLAAQLWAKPILPPGPPRFHAIRSLVAILQEEPPDTGTRFYSTPNDQLVLTYYSGIPVQSIAPVRKEFFDSYPSPIILFDKIGFADEPGRWDGNPVFRGFALRELPDWWKVFFYRFVDPVSRGGSRLNYRDRPGWQDRSVGGWIIHRFPPLPPGGEVSPTMQAGSQGQGEEARLVSQ